MTFYVISWFFAWRQCLVQRTARLWMKITLNYRAFSNWQNMRVDKRFACAQQHIFAATIFNDNQHEIARNIHSVKAYLPMNILCNEYWIRHLWQLFFGSKPLSLATVRICLYTILIYCVIFSKNISHLNSNARTSKSTASNVIKC